VVDKLPGMKRFLNCVLPIKDLEFVERKAGDVECVAVRDHYATAGGSEIWKKNRCCINI